MRTMDALFSFPPLILALTVAALLGADINDAAIAIAIVFIPGFVRLLRGEVIAVREEAYIESARSLGATSKRLIGRHVLPNVASPIIIQLALSLGFALLAEAGLSFLGVGEQPPTPSWGGMLQEGFQFINSSPWALIFPGLAIMLSVLAFNLVADGLRDSLGRERPAGSSPVAGEREGRRHRLGRFAAAGRPAAPPVESPSAALLEVEHLRVEFLTRGGWLPVMEDASFSVQRGQTLGLVGESGSGKTVSALAVMGLLPAKVSRRLGLHPLRGSGADEHQPGQAAPAPGQRDGHDLPGADDQPESRLHGREPDRRAGADASRPQPGRRLEGGRRGPRPGGDPPGGAPGPRTTRTPSRAACASG